MAPVLIALMLSACYNPVEPSFSIRIDVNVDSSSDEVSVYIFNATGEKIVTLMERAYLLGGGHRVTWNGLNYEGEPVVEGLYYYQIEYWTGDSIIDRIIERFVVR